MNQLQVFNFQNNEVRTVNESSEVWFNLNDVCKILEIKNPRDTKSRLKQDGVVSTDVIDSLGRTQQATFINEPNLYKVIFQSRKDEAEQFQEWVYEEVLPQIRQTGKYEAPKDPMEIMRLQFEALDQTNKEVKTLKNDVTYLKDEVKLEAGEYSYISKRVHKTVSETIDTFALANTQSIRGALYKDINSGVNEIAGIKTRTQLKQKHFDQVIDFISQWTPSTATLMKVRQITLELTETDEERPAD